MKTYETAPRFDVAELLSIDKAASSFFMPVCDNALALLAEYRAAYPPRRSNETEEAYQNAFMCFASMFIFDCGRIYGIRQERARRRGTRRADCDA